MVERRGVGSARAHVAAAAPTGRQTPVAEIGHEHGHFRTARRPAVRSAQAHVDAAARTRTKWTRRWRAMNERSAHARVRLGHGFAAARGADLTLPTEGRLAIHSEP